LQRCAFCFANQRLRQGWHGNRTAAQSIVACKASTKADSKAGCWKALTTPTTLVRGAKSFFVNDDDAAEFARTAPGFQRVIVVPDSAMIESPTAVVDVNFAIFPVVPLTAAVDASAAPLKYSDDPSGV
jgi:pimeloyl-ACP methyl ester carboxylesterase